MKRGVLTLLLLTWCAGLSVRVLTQPPPPPQQAAPRQPPTPPRSIPREVVVARHLADGTEHTMTIEALIAHGRHLFTWVWNARDGAGRPIVSGHGDASRAPREALRPDPSMARLSGADATACARCHHEPFGIAGGGGTMVANVLAFGTPGTRSAGSAGNGDSTGPRRIVNARATVGLFGAGFLEMLARQITTDLQAIRDRLRPDRSAALTSKGLAFGTLARRGDGSWDTTAVLGLSAPSLSTMGAKDPPSLVVRPFHQAGAAVSLRQFTNDAFQLHHGIQSAERVGRDADPDGDGFANELTRADVTAVTIFEATLAVPGRVIPNDPAIEAAVRTGERLFEAIGCARCHVPALPLDATGWIFSEPSPFNPTRTLRAGEAKAVIVDLTSDRLPPPRLAPVDGVVWVPAYTDFRLHDITTGADDPDREPLDQQQTGAAIFDGNGRFITKRLWGAASEPPFYHNGRYTTLRAAIVAHAGEALAEREAFEKRPAADQQAIVAFLDTLRVLPPGTRHLIVDERGQPKAWPSGTVRAPPRESGKSRDE